MTDLEWREPPTLPRGPGAPSKYRPIGDQLRARPQEWAVIAHDVSRSVASQIKRHQALGPGRFEVISCGEGKRGDVYARFLGDEDGA